METGKPRTAWVDVAKGTSIILVALYHATLMFNKLGYQVSLLTAANEALATVRMPVFFMAAGFFASSSISQPWRSLMDRRVGYFVYLFAFWTLIRFAFFSVVPNPQTPSEGHSIAGLIVSFVKPETGLWFLWALAMYYFGVKLTSRIDTRIMLLGAVVISIIGFAGLAPLSWVHNNVVKYFVFFYAACRYREIINNVVSGGYTVILAALPLYVCLVALADWNELRIAEGLILLSSGVVGVVSVCALANLIAGTFCGHFIAYLGRNTLGIYLAHVMLLAALAQAVRRFIAPDQITWDLALPLFGMVFAITASRLLEISSEAVKLHRWLYEFPLAKSRKSSSVGPEVAASHTASVA